MSWRWFHGRATPCGFTERRSPARPSAVSTASASATLYLSWLNRTPDTVAVYPSPGPSPTRTQHSVPGGRQQRPLAPHDDDEGAADHRLPQVGDEGGDQHQGDRILDAHRHGQQREREVATPRPTTPFTSPPRRKMTHTMTTDLGGPQGTGPGPMPLRFVDRNAQGVSRILPTCSLRSMRAWASAAPASG